MKKSVVYGVIGASIAVALGITGAIAFGIIPTNFSSDDNNNRLPEIIVSPKQVLAGSHVALLAERVVGIDDSKLVSYHWTQLSGERVDISNDNSSRLTFSIDPAKEDRIISFRVDVSDGKFTKSSIAKVTVLANTLPLANAGKDITVGKNQQVVLDGSKSQDPENSTLTYRWSQTDGPRVEMSAGDISNPSFVAPSDFPDNQKLTLSFQLVVNDGTYDSKPDLVKVNVKTSRPQVVNAGLDQNVSNGEIVKLNATVISGSENLQIAYRWNQTGGPMVELSDPNAANPTFMAPSFKSDKVLTFRLIVSDGTYDSKPAYTRITVNADKPPLADPGPSISVGAGDQVTLDGTKSSDPENDHLTYKWNQTSGPAVQLSDMTSGKPTFKAPILVYATSKVLSFKLLVNDGTYDSKPAYVKVTVVNTMPTANGGTDLVVKGGAQVTLNGSESFSPDGGKLTYKWNQTSGPAVQLSDPTSSSPTFTAPSRGDKDTIMTFQLVVSNNVTNSKPDIVTVKVPANRSPIADAGPDQTYKDRDVVVLDGTKSIDPDGDILTFRWKQISGPSVTLNYASQVQSVFHAHSVSSKQVLKFELTVSDGLISKTDTVAITIKPT